ncbi:MAG: hypothetical protein Q7R88_01620 [bacterium]|nr:hypothetical protein [bacterium]
MRGTLYTKEIKRSVDEWRAKGKTYSEIGKKFNVPKSTLSTWFNKKYPVSREKQLKHLALTRPLALAAIQRRIAEENRLIEEKVAGEIKTFPLQEIGLQKAILASLYWAEGSKNGNGLKFANTDPNLHQLFIILLRQCFHPEESGFRVHVYVHHYHNIRECEKFWSELLQVPLTQFWKTYIKKRSKTKRFRKNFMGICFLYHADSKLRKEILTLAGQLHKSYIQTAPVVQRTGH